jgi:hypothetical protein
VIWHVPAPQSARSNPAETWTNATGATEGAMSDAFMMLAAFMVLALLQAPTSAR